jgi:[ribosomal protein S5]-alanine N-acetyltransferase
LRRLGGPGGVALVSTTPERLAAARTSAPALAAALGAALPGDWPPEHIDDGFWQWIADALSARPDSGEWLNWFVLHENALAGTAGFKGPPDAEGWVEVGYSVVPSRQRRGIATHAVRLLVAHAFADPRVNGVAAETIPDNEASIKVATRAGLSPLEGREDPEAGTILRFGVARGEWAAAANSDGSTG